MHLEDIFPHACYSFSGHNLRNVCKTFDICLVISIFIFSDDRKHKKSLRQKLDSLSKEKSKDKGNVGLDLISIVTCYSTVYHL